MAIKAPVRRAVKTPETRAIILRSAEHIFAERGLAGARIDAIAAAAGVNKALIYYYFKSKDALFLAVIEEHLKEFYGARWLFFPAMRARRTKCFITSACTLTLSQHEETTRACSKGS